MLFKELVAKKCVYRGQKPVYWSPKSHTALAEAELESERSGGMTRRYNPNHRSESVFLTFDLKQSSNPAVQRLLSHSPLQALVYTTTPWTVPSNVCLCVNPDAEYCVVATPENRRAVALASRIEHFLIMRDRVDAVASLVHASFTVLLDHVPGVSLQGSTYAHPLFSTCDTNLSLTHRTRVVIAGHHVTNDMGTGIVHTAPAHGLDDFLVCKYHRVIRTEESMADNGIPRVVLPEGVHCEALREDVDDDGRFTSVWGARLQGAEVLGEGNREVVGEGKDDDASDEVARGDAPPVPPPDHHPSLPVRSTARAHH